MVWFVDQPVSCIGVLAPQKARTGSDPILLRQAAVSASAATRNDRNKMKAMDSARWLGANRSDTRGIARICNDATGSKARFHVSISPGCSTSPRRDNAAATADAMMSQPLTCPFRPTLELTSRP